MVAEKILVVDENPGVKRTLERFLAQNGYSVIATDNIKSASDLISIMTPLLLMLDIKMPRLDGIEFIHVLRKSNSYIPIMVMTAYPTFFTREEALKCGVDAYVTKPFDPAEILQCIRQMKACKGSQIEQVQEVTNHETHYSKAYESFMESGTKGKIPITRKIKN